MPKIKLTRGQFAIVDAGDYEALAAHKWRAQWNPKTQSFYAARSCSEANGEKKRVILMHREILGLKRGDKREGDHRNSGRTLDNRRRNLRIATSLQNKCNARIRKDNTSGFKGVGRRIGCATFLARVYLNRRVYQKSGFRTARAASRWYAAKVRELHGEFARIK